MKFEFLYKEMEELEKKWKISFWDLFIGVNYYEWSDYELDFSVVFLWVYLDEYHIYYLWEYKYNNELSNILFVSKKLVKEYFENGIDLSEFINTEFTYEWTLRVWENRVETVIWIYRNINLKLLKKIIYDLKK